VEFKGEQREHGHGAQWLGPDGYVWRWGAATMENWQSEFLQFVTFVILTAFLIQKGSHESKDSDEEMMAALQRIEKRLDAIEGITGGKRGESTYATAPAMSATETGEST